MNWEFLSEMIAELAAENGRVMLPRLGVFVAELAPASFSDKGFTIHPPYRRLIFRESQGDGSLMYEYYSQKRGVSLAQAQYDISEMVSVIKELLSEDGVAELPNLGKFKQTVSGSVLFVADEQLDISGELMALDVVSLKSQRVRKPVLPTLTSDKTESKTGQTAEKQKVMHETESEDAQAPAPEPAPAPASEPAPAPDSTPAPESEPLVELIPGGVLGENLQEDEEDNGRSKGFIVFLVLLLLVGLFFALFYVGVYFFPDLLDILLYNDYQLELLKYFEK